LAKRDLDDGRVGVFLLPQEQDLKIGMAILEQVPTLENAIRMPTKNLKEKVNKDGS
jgi:hypothetical protein